MRDNSLLLNTFRRKLKTYSPSFHIELVIKHHEVPLGLFMVILGRRISIWAHLRTYFSTMHQPALFIDVDIMHMIWHSV